MKRRDFLRATAALPALAATRGVGAEQKPRDLAGMNVVLFITDQERATQHFPPNWVEENLPGETRLRQHGLSFDNAFCNACMCSPSRATLMTGYFPAQHGVKDTLEENMPDSRFPQNPLPLDLPNIATEMEAAGYHVPYKGKWHMSKPEHGDDWTPQDVNQYGFERWDPPDAGANQDLDQFGGGFADNDGRFMDDQGTPEQGREGVISYLQTTAFIQQPFFLIVSLVNPHDVLSYPKTWTEGGYLTDDWLDGDIGLPETVGESLATKPTAQALSNALINGGLGSLPEDQDKINYLNFYGNLIKASDDYLVDILDELEDLGLFDNTLIIKTSDHGEMGMTHGGQRQKVFNFYEETLRVPLIYSNPGLFPSADSSDAMVSHVDFLPTLASLFHAPQSARVKWQGVDYSKLVLGQSSQPVQDYIAFTYDDVFAGQPTGPYVPPPNHIVSIREERYKLARYYDAAGEKADQWEMYDLQHDPLEIENIAFPAFPRTQKQEEELLRLKARLAEVEETRLQPLGPTPPPPPPRPAQSASSTSDHKRKHKKKKKKKRKQKKKQHRHHRH
jgi:arylsulfatase A-like enzyme